jgi:hypothetical protein
MDAARVRKELNVALYLCQHSEEIWELCLAGQVDGYRASLIADAARQKIDRADDVMKFMTGMLKFLRKHLTGVDGDPDAEPVVTCTVVQLRNATDYAIRKLQPAREDEEFRKAYDARTASARPDAPGMGWLSINGRIDQVKLADHRPTVGARRKRAQGDERTIAPLKADLALDLLIGKEDAVPVPAYPRPTVNLTVPDPGSHGPRRRAGRAVRRHGRAGFAGPDDRARAGRHLAPDADRRGRSPGRAVHEELPAHRADLAARGRRAEHLLPARLRCAVDRGRPRPPDRLAARSDRHRQPVAGLPHRLPRQARARVRHRAGGRRRLRAAYGGRIPPSDPPHDTSGLGGRLLAGRRARRVSVRGH